MGIINCEPVYEILKQKQLADIAYNVEAQLIGYMRIESIFNNGRFERKGIVAACLIKLESEGAVERRNLEGLDGVPIRFWRIRPDYYYPTPNEIKTYLEDCERTEGEEV